MGRYGLFDVRFPTLLEVTGHERPAFLGPRDDLALELLVVLPGELVFVCVREDDYRQLCWPASTVSSLKSTRRRREQVVSAVEWVVIDGK